jgi:hypothetical protein
VHLTTVTASVTLPEAQQLRQLAAAREVSMTRLVREALTKAYGVPARPDDES